MAATEPKYCNISKSYILNPRQGFYSSVFWSVIRTQSQCQIVSFFPKWGPKIPNVLQTAKVKNLSTKFNHKLMCNAQISLDKIRKSE